MTKRILALILALAMCITVFAGCGKNPSADTPAANDPNSSAAPGEVAYEDLPTIDLLYTFEYKTDTDNIDNVVWKELSERLGVKVNVIFADTDKYNAMIASGQGYDMTMVIGAYMHDMSVGGSLMPLDDLVAQHGPNITKMIPNALEYSKEFLSDDSGALYWLPTQVEYSGSAVGDKEELYGRIRWDLYADMGYPETKSSDEYLQLLKDMMEKYPTNADGEKVYGMAVPSDFLRLAMNFPMAPWSGVIDFSATGGYRYEDMSYVCLYGEDGPFWDGIDFFHKAYQMGLLDPDSFIMNDAELTAKANDGRLLWVAFDWEFDEAQMAEGTGFMAIPASWHDHMSTEYKNVVDFGLPITGFAVNKNSDKAELCMKFLDYIYTEEGSNLILNGIEGVHYTVDANGKRAYTQEAIDLYNGNSDKTWEEAGLGTAVSLKFAGLSYKAIASDGQALMLTEDPSSFEGTLSAVQKDFCEYYGVDYPSQIFFEYADKYDLSSAATFDPYVKAYLPTSTDEISQIEAAIKAEAEDFIADLVMASDAEYEAKVAEAYARLEKLGLNTLIEYYETNWVTTMQLAEAAKAGN